MVSVRIMTWNIQSGHSQAGAYVIGEQGQFIKSLKPDVVMLQEVADAFSNNSNNVDQTKSLAEAAGLAHYHYWMLEDWRNIRGGIALLSRWPLAEIEELRVPRPWYTYLPWSYEGQRGILSASVVVDGTTWRVRSTHMSHNGGAYIANHTHLLAQQAAQTPSRMWPVVGGDFNLGQSDPRFDELHQYMDVAAGVGGEIDLVWVGKGAEYRVSAGGRVDGQQLSDHDPTLVTLELVGTTPAPPPRPPLGRLTVRFTPSPLQIPARTGGTRPVHGAVSVTITAADAATGAAKAGIVRVDAGNVGGAVTEAPTGRSVKIPFLSEVGVDPTTHEREVKITIAEASVVSVPGYRDQPLDWGV